MYTHEITMIIPLKLQSKLFKCSFKNLDQLSPSLLARNKFVLQSKEMVM